MASFGPRRQSECGHKPAGFTRLTPKVLDWVKKTAGIYHPGLSDPGDILIFYHDFVSNDHVISAVLISGGWVAGTPDTSAEIFHPDRESSCVLPDMPKARIYHTQDGSLVCGGKMAPRSCHRWNPDTGAWDLVTEALTEPRVYHTSWTPVYGSVTYLIGSYWPENDKTTESIDIDNGVRPLFPLKYRFR